MNKLPTLIINLPESTERRRRILSVTASMPFLDVVLIEAINGKNLSEKQKNELVHPRYSQMVRSAGMSSGELGCALSHRKCYESILNQGLKYALVLEDDVLIGKGFEEALAMSCAFLDNHPRPSVVLLSARTVCSRKSIASVGRGSLHKAYSGVGAYGYIVNLSGAKLLYELALPYRCPADHWFNHRRHGLSLYATLPHVTSFTQDRSDSVIHPDRERLWRQYVEHNSSSPRLDKFRRRFSYERISIKIVKTFFGATEHPQIWP